MEQTIKLTGRIAEVLPVQTGTSQRTGDKWMSQEYVLEYFEWSGSRYANRVCCRVFGEDNIKKFDLKQFEEVTLSLYINANRNADGTRWFNEIRVRNVERADAQKPTPIVAAAEQPAEKADDLLF